MKYLILNKQKGLILIEFTLSFIIFWIIFIAIFEFGRAMLAWNAASEATRLSARVASICTKASKSAITNKTLNLLQLTGQVFYIDEIDQIDQDGKVVKKIINIDMSHDDLAYDGSTNWLKLDYSPNLCSNGNCESVSASLSKLYLVFGIAGFTYKIPLPSSPTTVLREGMSTLNKFNTDNLNNFCR